MTGYPVLAGAEAFSHVGGDGAGGVLVLHGFAGSPAAVRGVAEAIAAAGLHVELPRLPGHGTDIADMVSTRWADWTAEVAASYERVAQRTPHVVVVGQSMGGSLALWLALQHDDVRGLVLVNPMTKPQPHDVREMIGELLAEGMDVVPGGGSDIAAPGVVDIAYAGTPLAPIISYLDEGLAPMAGRYGELTMPLVLFTSRHDHVVEAHHSEHLADTYGGEVDHRWLERSYHVATLDHDSHDITTAAVTFGLERTATTEDRPQ